MHSVTSVRNFSASQATGIAWTKPGEATLGTLGYGYDALGRRVTQTGTYASQWLPEASQGSNMFDDNNRQTRHDGKALSYDANGNLLSDGQRTYLWNARNELIAIKVGDSVQASFQYDVLGRRISKTEGGQTTTYLYDGVDIVQERLGNTVNPILTGPGIDQRFARNEGNERTYFLTDALGSTRALTNAAGEVIQRYDYTPYGQTRTLNAGTTNPYQYTGRERDASGIYYYRARYYSPGMGRFISEDPIGLGGGTNIYAYVAGDPISATDPYGLFDVRAFRTAGGTYQYEVTFYSGAFGETQRKWGPAVAGGVSKIGKWVVRSSKLIPDPAGVSSIPEKDKRKQCDSMDAEAERIFKETVNYRHMYHDENAMKAFLNAFFRANPDMKSVYGGGADKILTEAKKNAIGWSE